MRIPSWWKRMRPSETPKFFALIIASFVDLFARRGWTGVALVIFCVLAIVAVSAVLGARFLL